MSGFVRSFGRAAAAVATALNTAGALVKRGAAGEFDAGVITATRFDGAITAQVAAFMHRFLFFSTNSPSFATAPPDDVNPASFMTITNVLRMTNTSGGNLNLNSLSGVYGQVILFINTSALAAETWTIKHQGTGVYKFYGPGAADVVVPRGGMALLWLDTVDFNWKVAKGF